MYIYDYKEYENNNKNQLIFSFIFNWLSMSVRNIKYSPWSKVEILTFKHIYSFIKIKLCNKTQRYSQHKSIKWLSLSLKLNNDDKSNEFSL